jgi:hypothetical protein
MQQRENCHWKGHGGVDVNLELERAVWIVQILIVQIWIAQIWILQIWIIQIRIVQIWIMHFADLDCADLDCTDLDPVATNYPNTVQCSVSQILAGCNKEKIAIGRDMGVLM